MAISIDPITVATLAVFLGVVGRILWPYWRKITDTPKDQPKPSFDYKFAITGVEAFAEGAVITGQILPEFLATVSQSQPVASMLFLFIIGFNYGWARTDINNRIIT